ncbi:response regulator [Desulfovibrio sp. UCD-KL4C]|uniref:hybrid sensor histidine kinase/response regulator n=1 Tax=Desulfovibrio sp. UCD-KL4C TaxID=2578120 RepID=UPI0025C708D7|nr:response regulator [Desulfovibrio sp. UCD-KL4C]
MIVLISLFAFIISGAYEYRSMRKAMLTDLNQKADGLAERLSESLIPPLWNVDQPAINRIILSEMNDKRIKAIVVTEDNDKTVFTGKVRDTDWNISNFEVRPTGELIKREAEISVLSQPIGAVEIYMSPQFIQNELLHSILSSLVRTMLLVILLMMTIFATMHKFLISPIIKLSKTARQISVDKNYGARVNFKCQGEMNILVENFNKMLQQIEEQDLKLKDYSGQLQQKIQQSNKNLASSYKELKEINKQLEIAKDEAEAASRLKSQFMANVSHEIRTPMNAIIGMADLTLATKLSAKQSEFIKIIINSGQVLLRLINDILDFSKVDAGKLELEEINFDLHQLIEDISDLFVEQMVASKSELVIEILPGVPRRVKADPLRLRQVLTNLTANAFKFTNKGEITITIKAESIRSEKIDLLFAVRDTGIGIPEHVQSELFTAFKQADGSTTRKYGGTGLGLSISKRIIDFMGGKIWVESEPGKGSTFFFKISPKRVPDTLPSEYLLPQKLQNSPVLIVDDNPAVRSVISRYLEQFGFNPETCPSAEEALEKIEQKADTPYKLILMDLILPRMNGDEASKIIRKTYSAEELPILMVTTVDLNNALIKADTAGISKVLPKPLKQSTLFDAVMETFGYYHYAQKIIEPQNIAEKLFKGFKALLVEDNVINQQVAYHILIETGLAIETADNGLEAVKKIEKNNYDLILMDIQMPEMDGYEATRVIRDRLKKTNLPIIAMTAHAMRGDKEKCLQAGMNDYIPKPIDKNQMMSVIKTYLLENKAQHNGIIIKENIQKNSEPDTDFKKFQQLDIEEALDRIGGDLNILINILKNFDTYNINFTTKIDFMLARGELKEAGDMAHALKGAAANLSAVDLAKAAQALENSCKADQKEDAVIALYKTNKKLELLRIDISMLTEEFS